MSARVIESEIIIPESRGLVWKRLTDAESMVELFPFAVSALGEPAPGTELVGRAPTSLPVTLTGEVLEVETDHQMAWRLQPRSLPGSVLAVRYSCTLTDADFGTRLHQRHELSGWLVSDGLAHRVKDAQITMNEALRSELVS